MGETFRIFPSNLPLTLDFVVCINSHLGLAAAVADPNTLLLWPGPTADSLQKYGSNGSQPHTLVVLDGTWHQARGIYNQNKFLHGIKQVNLRLAKLKNYYKRYPLL